MVFDMYAYKKAEKDAISVFEKAYGKKLPGNVSIERPPPEIKADIAVPCFGMGKNPSEISKKVAEKINKIAAKNSMISGAFAAGPYVNMVLNMEKFSNLVLKEILEMKHMYGSHASRKKKIIIDMSSPNIAKPMHIGHMRSTIIGESLSRILGFYGYDCVKDNHIGDWGTQFGKLLVAYGKWGNAGKLKKDAINHLTELYIMFHEKETPELAEEAREAFMKLEQGDGKSTNMWKSFCEMSMAEFEKIYSLLGVDFDTMLGESFYYKKGKKIVEQSLRKGIAEHSEGAVIVKFDDKKSLPEQERSLPPLVIQKSDEATLYSTRDIAAIEYRERKYSPEKIIYVIGSEQGLYLRQVFALAKLLGFKSRCVHADFGMVTLGGTKMSTRAGKSVLLKDLLDEAVSKAMEIIEEKGSCTSCKKSLARQIGIGAVIFNDLKQDRIRNIGFEWEKMLGLEGDTSAYIQYSYVRASSILEKAGARKRNPVIINLETEEEQNLVKIISRFPEAVERSAQSMKPHFIAQYLLDICSAFNDFYTRQKVIGSDHESERISLVRACAFTIKNGLSLLNIEYPEKM